MTAAHEQIRQALEVALRMKNGHADEYEWMHQAIYLLDSHVIVHKDRLNPVNTDSRDLDVVNYING